MKIKRAPQGRPKGYTPKELEDVKQDILANPGATSTEIAERTKVEKHKVVAILRVLS